MSVDQIRPRKPSPWPIVLLWVGAALVILIGWWLS
jgi:hypothetical protein